MLKQFCNEVEAILTGECWRNGQKSNNLNIMAKRLLAQKPKEVKQCYVKTAKI